MPPSPSQYEARRLALKPRIEELAGKASVTAAEDAELDELLAEYDRAGRLADAARFAQHPENIIGPRDNPFHVNTRTGDPFDTDRLHGLDPERRTAEARAMAKDIVERHTNLDHVTDAGREHATKMLERGDDVSRDVAELAIYTGSDEYRQNFVAHVRNPGAIAPRMYLEKVRGEVEARTAVSLAGTEGALWAFALDPTLLINNTGVVNPVRQVCRNVTITGTNSWYSPATAGVTASVIGESTAFTDASPSFTSTAIQVYKQGAFAFGSWESVADSDLASEISMLFADAKNRLEGQLFTTGTGSSQPTGVVTYYSNATSVVTGLSTGGPNSADLSASDIYNLRAQLSPRWRDRAVWFANLAVANSIRQLGTSTNFHAFSLDLTQGDADLRLLGKPFYEVSDMDSTIVSGSTDFCLLHFDPQAFVCLDRVGLTLLYEPLVTSGSKYPTGESAFVAYWRSGSGGLAQDSGRLLKL